MAKTKLSAASFVEHGYGQVEPNHLSAQRTAQIYAQLPVAAAIKTLENGQFVKYNYADGVCDYDSLGEWMLVFNEVKLYRDHLGYDDFAMKAEDYVARVYSPVDGAAPKYATARNYGEHTDGGVTYPSAIAPADPYEPTSTTTPFQIETFTAPKMMPTGTVMVPRVFKTNVGDIFTTNCVSGVATSGTPAAIDNSDILVGKTLAPDAATGILTVTTETTGMLWQIVKVYTLADRQKAVKLMRIA